MEKYSILSNPVYFDTNAKTLSKARALRNNMTEAEKLLWEKLRNKQIEGLKFRRQHAIGQFIVDFYCHEKKLTIEVDGGYHLNRSQSEYDNNRTYELEKFGLKVLRFKNDEIINDINNVVQDIKSFVTTH